MAAVLASHITWVDVVSLLVSIVSAGALIATVVIYGRHLTQLRSEVELHEGQLQADASQRRLEAMLAVSSLLQRQDQRVDRGTLRSRGRQLADGRLSATDLLGDESYVAAADSVGHAMQTLGFWVTEGLVPAELVLRNWGKAISDAWDDILPWTRFRRDDEGWAVWAEFEELVGMTPGRSS